MRWHLCILPFFFFQPIANAAISEPQNEEEALFIRRIADFWQEGEYQIVKKQIEEFLREYPESSMAQSLSATLGDLYIREKNYQGALAQYARINDPALLSRTFLNRMQCLFDLQWFATLADECEEFLKQADLDPDLRQGATYFLAIALYQQCLNTPKESETLQRLAARAQPHFQFLLQSALSQDVAQAFAHLSCILKDFVSASQIYLRLAEQNNSNREEMLFQAAVMQAEFDKPLAQQTFEEISTMGQKRSHDALYNRLVLSYDLGQYEEVLIKKDALLAEIPPERQEALHLFFGRSHLHLNQYPEALQELQLYAKTASASETLRSALVDMLEVAYLVSDESGLKQTLNRLLEEFPDDKQIPKGFLAHAMLLKKSEKFNDALQELETIRTRFSSSEEIEPALFEQIQIEHQQNRWTECSQHSREFVQKFPKNTLAPYAWRYLATAMAHLADNSDDPLIRETLAQDLESMLAQDKTQTEQEYGDWSFLLAKTYYETAHLKNSFLKEGDSSTANGGRLKAPDKINSSAYPPLKGRDCASSKLFNEAGKILQYLAVDDALLSKRANILLLLALTDRDGNEDYDNFCKNAERALAMQADLLDEPAIHIALFNGYLASKNVQIDKAAEHLFAASESIDIEPDNLLWLADYYYGKLDPKSDEDLLYAQRASHSLEKFLASTKVNIDALDETTLPFESALVKLAELQGLLGQKAKQIALLESLKRQQESQPSWAWSEESKVNLLLAASYAQDGRSATALKLLDQIVAKNPTIKTLVSASAALESARLRMGMWAHKKLSNDHPDAVQILAQLKTLLLQKNLANEPIHLEAAIEYVDFQTRLEGKTNAEKRLSILSKIKYDFENTDDLLSRDYQNSRKTLPEKDRLYQAYMALIDADILRCRSFRESNEAERALLRDLARKALQEIASRPLTAFLLKKAQEQLEQMDGP